MKPTLKQCFEENPIILTEGSVGLRVELEHGITPDPDIRFAALPYHEDGRAILTALHREYLAVGREHGLPMMITTSTRRASGERVARSAYRGRPIMADYASFLRGLTADLEIPVYIGGLLGCRGDAYRGDDGLPADEAFAFHAEQVAACRDADLDFLMAGIMPCLPEAMGMVRAIEGLGFPYIVSLMIGKDGCLLDGTPIDEAIGRIDDAVSTPPLCYITNCVYPSRLLSALSQPFNDTPRVRSRFWGIQANAADDDPAALDHCGARRGADAQQWTRDMMRLQERFPMRIVGGCCGTDATHMRALAGAIVGAG